MSDAKVDDCSTGSIQFIEGLTYADTDYTKKYTELILMDNTYTKTYAVFSGGGY